MASNTADLTVTEQEPDIPAFALSEISPIETWLEYVTRMLAFNDVLLLKLCLYPMFKNRSARDNAKHMSELFHAMIGSDDPKQQQTVLYNFVCALKVIGGKKRGINCIAKLTEVGIEVPKASDYQEDQEFRFFQCLARVARDIEDDKDARDMIKEAYGKKLEINHRNVEHIANMFTAIYEEQLVTPDECTEFLELLRKCKDGALYEAVMQKFDASTCTGDMWESNPSSEPSSMLGSVGVRSRTMIDPSLPSHNNPESGPQQEAQLSVLRKVLLTATIILFFTFAIISVISTSLAVVCRHVSQPDISNLGAYTGNTMIVTEVYPTLASHLTVKQKILHDDSPHLAHMYLVDSSCEDLPIVHMEKHCYNNTSLENITAVYLLPGSLINYNFSASTLKDEEDIIDIFVVKGIQNIRAFHPINDRDYPLSQRITVGPQEIHENINYNIISEDYYALIILHRHDIPMNLSYNASVQILTIDIQQLRYEYNHSIAGDIEEWQQTVDMEFCSHRKCLIANIGPSLAHPYLNFVHFNVKFSLHSFGEKEIVQLAAVTAAVTAVIAALSGFLSILFLFLLVCHRRKIILIQQQNTIDRSSRNGTQRTFL